MQLDIEKTKIDVVEQKAEGRSFTDLTAVVEYGYFVATLDGESFEGHSIQMNRQGKTPDAAIKSLFDAMTAAGVTL